MNHKAVAILIAIVALFGIGHYAFGQMKHMKMMDMRSHAVKHAVMVIREGEAHAAVKGNYTCCLKHPCDYCEIHMGACPCGKHVRMGMPVCSECKGGWMVGDGAVHGIKPSQVKGMPRGMMSMKGGKM